MKRDRIAISPETIGAFCRKWQIIEFALFGSILREDYSPTSDVDILVRFAPEAQWSLFDLAEMHEELEALFGRKVDLVEQEALRNPFRRQAILRSKEVLYAA